MIESTLRIPTPCEEDWNKMEPTSKGAYCDKCRFEVIDFTKKTPEEIRAILKKNRTQRTCGHITQTQIDLVNTDYHLWENQSFPVFKSKFLYACLIVFGLSLFTGCQDISNDRVLGEIAEPECHSANIETITGDTIYWDEGDSTIDGMMEIIDR